MTITITERVAANVRAELSRARRNQDALARALELSQSGISKRLRGAVPFRLDEIERAARFLDVPLSALVPDEDATA